MGEEDVFCYYTEGSHLESGDIEKGFMKTKLFKRGHTKNMQWFEPIILSAVLPVVQKGL